MSALTGCRFVCDRDAVIAWLGRSKATVRKHVPVIGYDDHGRALCDLEQAAAILAAVPARRVTDRRDASLAG